MNKLEKLVTLIPMHEIEHEAQQQIFNALEHDFVKKLAIMPDVHTGYSLPIGAVALLDGMISPAYVGYDISCGMVWFRTGIDANSLDQRDKEHIFHSIYRDVPCGEGKCNTKDVNFEEFESASGDKTLTKEVKARVHTQLGTLGGGNHFIELGRAEDTGELTITIHSGSRNLGYRICTWYSQNAPEFIPIDSELGKAYYQDMKYCVSWAKENRLQMLFKILNLFDINSIKRSNEPITVTHNFAEVTPNGIIHRKGATPAKMGEIGVIPGNMRDGVWLVEGTGNKEFLESSSHGCGRTMSRTKAKENIKMEDFENSMKGIVANIHKSTLDESPMAYKNSDMVINAQDGIVFKVITKSIPIINVKG